MTMRAIRALIVGSAGFEDVKLTREALNLVWRSANHGRRPVEFVFRSRWNDADRVESSTEIAYSLCQHAVQNPTPMQSWISRVELLNMLELKGTRTREWLSIESPDIIVILEHGKHDEWLDPFRQYCRDFGATLITKRS